MGQHCSSGHHAQLSTSPLLHVLLCRRAKYQLQHVVRTNLAANDAAYGCVFETEDDSGIRGVKLSKELMSVAGEQPYLLGALGSSAAVTAACSEAVT